MHPDLELLLVLAMTVPRPEFVGPSEIRGEGPTPRQRRGTWRGIGQDLVPAAENDTPTIESIGDLRIVGDDLRRRPRPVLRGDGRIQPVRIGLRGRSHAPIAILEASVLEENGLERERARVPAARKKGGPIPMDDDVGDGSFEVLPANRIGIRSGQVVPEYRQVKVVGRTRE